jgi:hypothetical protein
MKKKILIWNIVLMNVYFWKNLVFTNIRKKIGILDGKEFELDYSHRKPNLEDRYDPNEDDF